MPLEVQKLDRKEILRYVQEVVNNNADNQVVDGHYASGVLTLTAHGGDTLEIPIKLFTEAELKGLNDALSALDFASEQKAGKIAIVSESDAKKGVDDTKAATARKVHIIIDALNLPTFELDNPQDDEILRLIRNEDGSVTVTNGEKSVTDLQKTTDKGDVTNHNIALRAENANLLLDRVVGVKNSRGIYVRDLTADQKNATTQLFAGLTADDKFAVLLANLERLIITQSDFYLRNLPETTDATLPYIVASSDGRLYRRAGSGTGTTPTPTPNPFSLTLTHYELVDEAVPMPKGAVDTNNCDKVTGWGQAGQHRIFCDVTEVARIQSTISRPDVKTALQNSGITGLTSDVLGFEWTKPIRFKDGQPHTWTVKNDAGDLYDSNVPALLTCATAVEREYMTPITVNEGGLGQQVQMVQVWTGGAESVYLGSKVYSLVSPPPGVSINAQGIFSAAADSVSQNVFVEVHIAVTNPDRVIIGQAQIINSICEREAGTTNYFLAWNFTPQAGGGARLFSSLDDANNTAGAKFDGTQPGTFNSEFGAGIKTLAVGQKVYFGVGLSCELVGNNIYYIIANGFVDTIKKAIRVVNGVITEIKDSTYATPTTPTVPDAGYVHDNTFTAALPNTYTPVGATWAVGSGQVCQTDAVASEGRLVLSGAAANANRVFAKLKVAQKGNVPSVGVGLCFANGGGYNLLLLGDNKLQFLNDGVAFGPAFDFNWQAGVSYWFDLKSETASGQLTLSGRVWKDGTARPATYPYTWAGLPARAGSAVLIGKAGNLGPACVEEWYVYAPAPVTPPASAAQVSTVRGQFWFGNDAGEQVGGPFLMSIFYAKVNGLTGSETPQIGIQSDTATINWFPMVPRNAQGSDLNFQHGPHAWGQPPAPGQPPNAINYWVRATPTSTPIKLYARDAHSTQYVFETTLYPPAP